MEEIKECTEMEGDSDKEVSDPINFDEVLLLRLTVEICRSTRGMRTAEFMDALDDLIPDTDDFKAILQAILHMPEENLPKLDMNRLDEKMSPYSAG